MRQLVLLALLAFLCAIGVPTRAAEVAVILSADTDAFDEAIRGFAEASEHTVIEKFDMGGDFEEGRRILREIESNVKPDLIFAVGIWAVQLIAEQPTSIPVVYSMILNPPSTIGTERENITGASINVPVEDSLDLLRQLSPDIKRVGVIYSRANTGYLVRQADLVAQEKGLQLIAKETNSPKEAIKALNALQNDGIDALWILPDVTLLDPDVIEYTMLLSFRSGVPLLGLSERQARMGAVLALSFASTEDIGRQAGELANMILAGTPAAEIPYTTARRVQVTVNQKAANKIGVKIPDAITQRDDAIVIAK